MSSEQLSKESAAKELDRFYEYYEVEKDSLGKEQLEALESVEPVLIKGIQKGLIEFSNDDDNGFSVVLTLRNGRDRLKFKEMNGDAKIAMSSKDENDSSGKCYALLGSLSGEGAAVIRKLKGPDLKRAEHIGALLLFC